MRPAAKPARDRWGRLYCRVPGCRVAIQAPTGLVELLRLQRHFQRAHLARLTMHEALDLRAKWERDGDGDGR